MRLDQLIAGLDVQCLSEDAQLARIRVCDLTDDSRTVLPGTLFIARSGTRLDGRTFIPEAVRGGAVAILTDLADKALARAIEVPVLSTRELPATMAHLAERFYGEPSSKLKLIGITGTNGKTTTAHLVHQLLNGANTRCGLIGTVMVDDGREIGPATLTTPPATELSRTLATMVEAGCKAGVMEVSSHALAQSRASALKFDIGIFTNLTGDHLDYHGTMEAYAAAKARLCQALPPAPDGWMIVNGEDPWAARMVEGCRANVVWCRVDDDGRNDGGPDARPANPDAQQSVVARAAIRSMSMTATRVLFEGPWGTFESSLRLIGRHNVMNALQALCAAWCAGIDATLLERALRKATSPPGRLEPVGSPEDDITVLVDYAHTDDALRKVISGLLPLLKDARGNARGRLILVFGCGGDRDQSKRPRMGQVAAALADETIVTSDNPRTERPSDIVDGILAGIGREARERILVEVDRRRAIEKAVQRARPGDLVLIAGKGHETEQIMPDGRGGTIRRHFDDREVARDALAERLRAGVHLSSL
jgi:UDP-N-acetylmuramoyl-L-alanyl-D-glutamate--2,6-diaminopimelate ligase